jgi:hypothetical protein
MKRALIISAVIITLLVVLVVFQLPTINKIASDRALYSVIERSLRDRRNSGQDEYSGFINANDMRIEVPAANKDKEGFVIDSFGRRFYAKFDKSTMSITPQ